MSDAPEIEHQDTSEGWVRHSELLLALLAGLFLFSLYLAVTRIYQVDEAQNAYMAWVVGAGEIHRHFASAPAFLLPFTWLARGAASPGVIFTELRLGFCFLFWTNLLLMVRGAGFRLRSRKGLGALLLLALLPPLWTYGLEIRHENIIVLGILLLWNLGRRPGRLRPWSFLLMGATVACVQASTFKSLAYWAPISIAMIFLPLGDREGSRMRALLHWLLGALVILLLLVGLHLRLGTWSSFVADQTGFLRMAGSVERFAPWTLLDRLFFQTPLLMGILLLPIAARLLRLRTTGMDWQGSAPEGLLFLWTLVPLAVNPNPFPYNVLAILAAGGMAAGAFLRETLPELRLGPERGALLLGVALATQGVPFLAQATILAKTDNDRQNLLMERAVELTDPGKDAVYDGAGLVPIRRSLGYYWFINIANVQKYRSGALPTFRSELLRDAPAVIIPTYRLSYLEPEDIQVIRNNYLTLAPDFLVLGNASKEADRSWNCLHPGRYAVEFPQGAPKGAWIRLDGRPAQPGVQVFSSGTHRIEGSPGAAPIILWVGPNLDRPPQMAGGEVLQGVFPIPNAF